MAASRREWRLIYLTTGEIGLADKMREARYPLRMMAGQAVRLIDLPADAEAGFGIFEALPEAPDAPDRTARTRGRAFADRLIAAAHASYGTAGPAVVERFIRGRESALDQVRQVMDELTTTLAPPGADGQVQRVARHLALVGVAGELAIGLEVLPRPTGEAVRAVEQCFADWVRARHDRLGGGRRYRLVFAGHHRAGRRVAVPAIETERVRPRPSRPLPAATPALGGPRPGACLGA